MPSRSHRLYLPLLLLLSSFGPLHAQVAQAAPESGSIPLVGVPRESALNQGRTSVVVDVGNRKLYVIEAGHVLWSADVGVGTGLRLPGANGEAWDFATPTGRYQVQMKERDPVWYAPDWYFTEHGLPIPPDTASSRRFPGELGPAAVFLQHDLAIHGTERPEILGQAVSHGCIRLSNANALRLYHEVLVGTEVLIVDGRSASPRSEPRAASASTGPSPLNQAWETWRAQLRKTSTLSLLNTLGRTLKSQESHALGLAWPDVAAALLDRAREDPRALDLFLLFSLTVDGDARMELDAFLAHAYESDPMAVSESLAHIARPDRDRIAEALVRSTLARFAGEAHDVGAPWPTRRLANVPGLEPEVRLGVVALRYAEARVDASLPHSAAPEPSSVSSGTDSSGRVEH